MEPAAVGGGGQADKLQRRTRRSCSSPAWPGTLASGEARALRAALTQPSMWPTWGLVECQRSRCSYLVRRPTCMIKGGAMASLRGPRLATQATLNEATQLQNGIRHVITRANVRLGKRQSSQHGCLRNCRSFETQYSARLARGPPHPVRGRATLFRRCAHGTVSPRAIATFALRWVQPSTRRAM